MCWIRVILLVCQDKGDPMECGSYRIIRLLEHAMKVVERASEYRIGHQMRSTTCSLVS